MIDPLTAEVLLGIILIIQGWQETQRRRDRERVAADVRAIVREEIAPPAQLLTGLAELARQAHEHGDDETELAPGHRYHPDNPLNQ